MILSTIIYFIRHAEPNYENHDDLTRELTENGCRASQQLVERFKGIEIDSFIPALIRGLWILFFL